MVKVITYGTYDLLHYGHIRLLERAKALGDYLIVGVTSDDYDKTRGKINNQQTLMQRVAAVKALGIADEVIAEEYEGQKIDDIRKYGVDIFTVGSDWEGKFDYLKEYCNVVYLPRTEGVSSSEIRAERRKVKICIIGELQLKAKFAEEASFVNGIEVVNDYDIADAVYVVSLPKQHYRDVKQALKDGKHVLCESPVALSYEECDELFELSKNKKLILMDAIKTAYSTAYQRLVLLAKTGKIGEIVSVDATCTSLEDGLSNDNFNEKQNSICAWGPTALLPIFQVLGTNYRERHRFSRYLDKEKKCDGFTKIDFTYEDSVASIKVAKSAKSEGELVITGTRGYIYVPAPWWRTDYFEIRYENASENRRYFFQLDGNGMRYEIAAFAQAVESKTRSFYITDDISLAICSVIE